MKDIENSLFVRYLLFCDNFNKSVSTGGYRLFRGSFLWRFLAANELDCWMFIDEHMDMSSSYLKKLQAGDENILKSVRYSNTNGKNATLMYKWALTNQVPKQLQVDGSNVLKLDETIVDSLYGRANHVHRFKDDFTLDFVLDGFDLLPEGTYILSLLIFTTLFHFIYYNISHILNANHY